MSIVHGHVCHESMNPRYQGWCDCGQKLMQPHVMARDITLERDIIEHAAHGIMDPSVLIERAHARAVRLCGEYVIDPMSIALDRNRPREVAEEIEDAVNHLVWWLVQHWDHPLREPRTHTLRLLLAAYQALQPDET